jgi:hypothetical protein
MMKKVLLFISFLLLSLLIFYTLLPNPPFPPPVPGGAMSDEPGDTESSLRHAYFTDLTREEVMAHYVKEMSASSFLNITLPTYRLNYPPEEAKTLIRDQTRSTFLEEVVHPLRESVYINGFEPKVAKDAIWIKGVHYRQKITVRYVPSSALVRILVVLLSLLGIVLVVREWGKTLKWIFQ